MSAVKLAVFDLDGTLLDTIVDLATVCNEVLQSNGFPEYTVEKFKKFVGRGANNLVKSALSPCTEDPDVVQYITDQFRQSYLMNGQVHTKPYDGVPDMLRSLREQGITIAILSNKPHAATAKLVDYYFPGLVDLVFGQREGLPIKPDPTVLWEICSHFGASHDDCVYIGDSEVDVVTAKQAGVACIAVSWGFRTKDELESSGALVVLNEVEEVEQEIIDIFAARSYTS